MIRLLWLVVLAAACRVSEPGPSDGTPPHVVIILADDMGYADTGFTGAEDIPTPALDALAAGGVVFTDSHVTGSVCAPSRAGLITAAYPQRFGFECNLVYDDRSVGLADGQVTLARRLGEAGYQTAAVGKWHLGSAKGQHPMDVGFEHFTGLLKGARSYFPLLDQPPGLLQQITRDRVLVPEDRLGYLTDYLSGEAVRLIRERESDRPLFLYLAYTAPHTPMHARADLLERFRNTIPDALRRKYAAMVVALDEGVARVTAALADEGMLDNTLLVFLSDNGGATNNGSDNGPWRGMKGSKWEGGHRVPMLWHWPARMPGGARYTLPVSSMDIGATALAAAGVGAAADLDGVDLRPFLAGALGRPHDILYWRRGAAAAVRSGDWKLIRIQEADGSYRAPLLVDLAWDPGETHDLAAERPEVATRLMGLLEAWEANLQPPSWVQGERWLTNQRLKHDMSVVGRHEERRLP